MASSNRLGELLVREKLISLQQLRRAQEEQRRSGKNLGYTLAKLGFISDGEIRKDLAPNAEPVIESLRDGPIYGGGPGLRFALSQAMVARVDVAFSDETAAFYVQVGSAWARP